MLQIPLRFLGSNWINVFSTSTLRHISTGFPLQINLTPILLGEPLKGKKKLDPALVRAKNEKKRRKLEKQLRLLKRCEKRLKPLVELQVPEVFEDESEISKRKRNIVVPEEVVEDRVFVFREYSKAKLKEKMKDYAFINNLLNSQEEALKELRLESEELYKAAVQIDENLIPYKFSGPVETPPIKSYDAPDGDYIDISRKWV